MMRIIDETYRTLPTLRDHYDFPADDQGRVNYRALRGPEYMRALRARVVELGVTILDQSPALELLARGDGSIGGARGIRLQHSGQEWQIESAAVILAAGGTSFRSHLLGSRTNTGDGYLMAAEAGAEMSGMEFTAAYTVAPLHSTMTRTMAYSFADYYDSGGRQIDAPFGHDQTERIAQALLAGPVYCSLHRLPADVRTHLPTISPNVMLPFARWGIDPYTQRFQITLHTDGTIRGIGGVRVAGSDCQTRIPDLFVAGDNASRELVAGASSGGGNVNSAWALSSGTWAGQSAARRARQRPRAGDQGHLEPLGTAGLRPGAASRTFDTRAIVDAVKAEMHPYDKNLFRRGDRLLASRRSLDEVWNAVVDHGGGGDPGAPGRLAAREAAALVATARWSVASAEARRESRGMHRRVDAPHLDPAFSHRLVASGLSEIRISPDGAPEPRLQKAS